jgi:hypothetical protein
VLEADKLAGEQSYALKPEAGFPVLPIHEARFGQAAFGGFDTPSKLHTGLLALSEC